MAGHQSSNYLVEGVEYPRVSTILPAFSLLQYGVDSAIAYAKAKMAEGKSAEEALDLAVKGWQEHSENAMETGRQAHDAVEDLSRGRVTEGPMSVEVQNVCKQWKAWNDTFKPEFLGIECQMLSKKYGYCGTADAICRIGGKVVVVDYKTSKGFYDNYSLQIAAYCGAFAEDESCSTIPTGLCVRFPKDGSPYEVKEYDADCIRRNLEAFRCLARAYYLQKKRRLKNNPHVAEIWGAK